MNITPSPKFDIRIDDFQGGLVVDHNEDGLYVDADWHDKEVQEYRDEIYRLKEIINMKYDSKWVG